MLPDTTGVELCSSCGLASQPLQSKNAVCESVSEWRLDTHAKAPADRHFIGIKPLQKLTVCSESRPAAHDNETP